MVSRLVLETGYLVGGRCSVDAVGVFCVFGWSLVALLVCLRLEDIGLHAEVT